MTNYCDFSFYTNIYAADADDSTNFTDVFAKVRTKMKSVVAVYDGFLLMLGAI